MFAVRSHLVLSFLLYLQSQCFHEPAGSIPADLNSFFAQIVHHHATAQAATGGNRRSRSPEYALNWISHSGII